MLRGPIITADAWNRRVVPVLRAAILHQGANIRLHYSPGGITITADIHTGHAHPWYTSAHWHPALRSWVATVAPGLTNAAPPVARIPASDAPARFAEFLALRQPPPEPDDIVECPLQWAPAIPLRTRSIGFDDPSASPEPIPPALIARGVAAKPAYDPFTDPAAPAFPSGSRRLAAADIVLRIPHPVATLDFRVGSPVLDSYSAIWTASYAWPAPGPATIRAQAGRFLPQPEADPLAILTGSYTPVPWTDVLVSRVYLLSPPDAPPDAPVDSSWEPAVRHALFWNEAIVALADSQAAYQPLSLFVPLAGGVAQPLINVLLSLTNDALSLAQIFAQRSQPTLSRYSL